jgi:ornithine cyclodeaminase/alanine dehydrogenase-like protein (mu-crystallin family)
VNDNGVIKLFVAGDKPLNVRNGREFLYLSQVDVREINLSMSEIVAALESMFREKSEGRVEMPPKIGVHTMPDAFLHAMPAYISPDKAVGMKWVGGYPDNHRRKLPYITGLLILNDPETGVPLSVMDCTWITAKRTGAATMIAAKYLARPQSQTVGILGCGVQGRSNLETLQVGFQLKTVHAYDLDQSVRENYAEEMSDQLGLDVIPVDDPKSAVEGRDIVVTSGPILRKPHATIQPGWLAEGSFASLVDFDSYWHPDALHEADKFCTDDVSQFEHYREIGYFQNVPAIYAELSDLVTGRKPGRETPQERTIACNLGLALDDIATALVVFNRALAQGVGTWLPL